MPWIGQYSFSHLRDNWANLGWLALVLFAILRYRLGSLEGWWHTLTNRVFPRSIYSHPSTSLDLKLQFAFAIFGHSLPLGLLGIRITLLDDLVDHQTGRFSNFVGKVNPLAGTSLWTLHGFWINAFWTLVAAALYDLGRTLVHFALHKIPALWEIHKVHHSAEVLTPLTDFRGHILERVMKEVLSGILVVTGTVIFIALFGPDSVSTVTVLGWNIATFLGGTLFGSLGHTYVWCNVGVFGLFVPNPAGHFIHHSAEARHRDKNFADVFPVWDLLLGTLYIPRGEEHFKIGVRDKSGRKWVPESVSEVVFGSVADSIKTAARRAPRSSPAEPAVEDGIRSCWCGPGCAKLGYAMDNLSPTTTGWTSLREIWNSAAVAAWPRRQLRVHRRT